MVSSFTGTGKTRMGRMEFVFQTRNVVVGSPRAELLEQAVRRRGKR